MTAGERFKNWIDGLSAAWGDRLRSWLVSMIMRGATGIMEDMEPEAIDLMRTSLDKVKEHPATPQELKDIIDTLKAGKKPLPLLLLIPLGVMILLPMITSIFQPLADIIRYGQQRLFKSGRLDPITAVRAAWRGDLTPKRLQETLLDHGFDEVDREVLEKVTKIRLDPDTWIKALFRKYEDFAKIADDLKHQGWDDDRIAALKFTSLFMPSAIDIVSWYAKEVYEPDMVERYGLASELPDYEKTDFPKIGVDSTQARNYWMAHWEHASYMQIREMVHRGVLSLGKEMPEPPTTKEGWAARDAEGVKAAYDWYRLVEIPPFWRARLTEMMFEVPTRVDVRRFWDMRTIDEERLRSIYHSRGYHGKDLDDYVLWTKVYVAFPDLLARFKNGWISLDEVKSELTALGMPAARVDEMIETKIKKAEPERLANERDLTKSDIYKGIKADRITRAEGLDLLMDLGFDEDEADVLLDTNVPEDITDKVVAQRELTKADILKGLKTKVLTRDQARERLMGLRYSPADADFLLKIFDAQVKPPVEPAEREASKADIVAAVKKDLITPEDAYLMLQDINFTPEAAQFILAVKAEVSAFSPVSYSEFKERTQKLRRAAGLEVKPMSEEIKQAAQELIRIKGEIDSLKRSIAEEKRGLIEVEEVPEETTKRLKSLQVKLHRAESKLAAAQSEYDRLIAEWRH